MARHPIADDRGVSESFAVGALLAITLLMVLSVGVFVLAVGVEEDQSDTTSFEYDYDGDADTLLVRYEQGEQYPADEILFRTESNEATWAELAGFGVNESIAPGDALQLSGTGSWGRPVTGATELEIYHVQGDNRTQLSNWTA